MVPLIGMTKDASVHHTRTHARSHFPFIRVQLRVTCDFGLWRGERGRVLIKCIFCYFYRAFFTLIHSRLSHAQTEDRLARLHAVTGSFVMDISQGADPRI